MRTSGPSYFTQNVEYDPEPCEDENLGPFIASIGGACACLCRTCGTGLDMCTHEVLGLAERFWKWSGTWGWFNLIFGISGSVAAPMGEYAAAVLLLTLGTVSLCSSLLHSNRRIGLKGLGVIALLLGYAYIFFVIYDFKGNQEWSHLSPYLRGTVVYVRAPTPISVQVEPRSNSAISAAERL